MEGSQRCAPSIFLYIYQCPLSPFVVPSPAATVVLSHTTLFIDRRNVLLLRKNPLKIGVAMGISPSLTPYFTIN